METPEVVPQKETQLVTEEPLTAEPVPEVPVKKSRKFPIIPVVMVIAILFFVVGVVATRYWPQAEPISTASPTPALPAATVVPTPATQSTLPKATATFSDPRVEGMVFYYDPAEWTVTKSPLDQGVKLILTNANGGILTATYGLPLGRGGSLHLLKQNELVSLTNGLARYRLQTGGTAAQDTYVYGTTTSTGENKTVVLFAQDPAAKQSLLEMCDPSYEGMTVTNEQECLTLQNTNDYVGYAGEPTFERIVVQRKVEITEFDPSWDFESGGMTDEGQVIVQIQYQGSSPTDADEIVKQLQF